MENARRKCEETEDNKAPTAGTHLDGRLRPIPGFSVTSNTLGPIPTIRKHCVRREGVFQGTSQIPV
jgi:hypothetical protein